MKFNMARIEQLITFYGPQAILEIDVVSGASLFASRGISFERERRRSSEDSIPWRAEIVARASSWFGSRPRE